MGRSNLRNHDNICEEENGRGLLGSLRNLVVPRHQGVLEPQDFLKIQEDLCRFLLRECCHDSGDYFDPWSELEDTKFKTLVHWDKDDFFRTHSQEYGVPGKIV